MSGSIDAYIGTCHEVVADPDLADIEYSEVVVCKEILSDFNVISVIAEKR